MNDLSWVLNFRHDLLTPIFWLFSHLADEPFLLAFCSFGYWCLNKRFYRDLTILLCIAAMSNVMLKAWFAIPRPQIDHLMDTVYGYSFPSGHATAATVAALAIASFYKRRSIWAICVIGLVGCCASRVYLGVHFPIDLIGGFIVGLTIVVAYMLLRYSRIWVKLGRQKIYTVPIALTAFAIYFKFLAKDIITINVYASGAILGVLIGDYLDQRYLKFQKAKTTSTRILFGSAGLFTIIAITVCVKIFTASSDMLPFLFMGYLLIGLSVTYFVPLILNRIRHLAQKGESPGRVVDTL